MGGRAFEVEIGPQTTAGMVLALLKASGDLPVRSGEEMMLGGWAVWEGGTDWGIGTSFFSLGSSLGLQLTSAFRTLQSDLFASSSISLPSLLPGTPRLSLTRTSYLASILTSYVHFELALTFGLS
jgi:hypothetical protein